MNTEEEARRRVLARQEAREAKEAEEARLRQIIKKQVDERLAGWAMLALLVLLIWWQGWMGFGAWIALMVAWAVMSDLFERWKPGARLFEVDGLAEDFVRHETLADLYEQGDAKWKLEGGEATFADHDEWGTFFTRLEPVLKSFENLSPKERQKEMKKAKKRSYKARLDMEKFAKENKAELPSWVRD